MVASPHTELVGVASRQRSRAEHAAQALGAGYACADCHAKKAGFFYATVAARSPAQIGTPLTRPMYELQGQKLSDVGSWERSARYRNTWIVIGLAAAAVLGLALANAAVISLGAILRGVFVRKPRRVG